MAGKSKVTEGSESPLVRLRTGLGLGRQAFALLLDVDPNVLGSYELGKGKWLPPRFITALKTAGFDAEKVDQEYREYHKSIVAEIRAQHLAEIRTQHSPAR